MWGPLSHYFKDIDWKSKQRVSVKGIGVISAASCFQFPEDVLMLETIMKAGFKPDAYEVRTLNPLTLLSIAGIEYVYREGIYTLDHNRNTLIRIFRDSLSLDTRDYKGRDVRSCEIIRELIAWIADSKKVEAAYNVGLYMSIQLKKTKDIMPLPRIFRDVWRCGSEFSTQGYMGSLYCFLDTGVCLDERQKEFAFVLLSKSMLRSKNGGNGVDVMKDDNWELDPADVKKLLYRQDGRKTTPGKWKLFEMCRQLYKSLKTYLRHFKQDCMLQCYYPKSHDDICRINSNRKRGREILERESWTQMPRKEVHDRFIEYCESKDIPISEYTTLLLNKSDAIGRFKDLITDIICQCCLGPAEDLPRHHNYFEFNWKSKAPE